MTLRPFHQARWSEPVVLELGSEGERGILLPEVEPEVAEAVGDAASSIPSALRRGRPPRLPELSQPHVLRHFLRLSQEALGTDVVIDVGQGTCTMKYSPKVHERVVRSPEVAELHPLQDDDTVQGLLAVMHRFERMLCAISGMDRFTFQPGGGAHGIYTNACIVRACHEARGEAEQRDEIITTVFSHPSDAACPATAGFKVITLYPGERGYPDLDALKAAVSERTAGLFIANPEDTGIYNPEIDRFVEVVHEAGGLCAYDQANANGILGMTRARDAGFDLCQFNVHKTFSSPHGSIGVGCGAAGVTEELARFLPVPTVERDGERYFLDWDRPDSIGKVRSFHGVPAVIVRAYAWVLSLGPDGLREVAEGAVLNNNYLARKLADVPGLAVSYAESNPLPRLEQIRYSWERLREETGVGAQDVSRRTADFGVTTFFTSHHPWLVPEPATLEPTETFSQADLDTYAAILRQAAEEAYADPELVRSAPHNAPIHRVDPGPLDDPERWALTWRAYERKRGPASPLDARPREVLGRVPNERRGREAPVANPLAGHTNTYHTYTLDDALAGIAGAGFRNVELTAVPGWTEHVELNGKDELRRKLDDHGLTAVSLSAHSDLTTGDGLEHGVRAVRWAADFGIPIVNTAIGGHASQEEDEKAFLTNIGVLADAAEQAGIEVALEIHGDIMASGAKTLPLLEKIGRESIRVNYDTANVEYYSGEKAVDDLARIAPYLAHVHLKDTTGGKGVWDFGALGSGSVDFGRVLEILDEAGYDGPFSVELEFQGEPWPPLEEVNDAMRRSYQHLSGLGLS